MKANRPTYLSMLLLPALQACTPPAAAPQATIAITTPAPAITMPARVPVAPGDEHKACSLVTAAEMSAILGNAMAATANDGAGVTACSYAPVGGSGSRAQIMISWGDGESTLQMVRAMKDHDAAGDLPYKGIGDDAVYESAAVVIRQGKDLIGVAVFGTPDVPAAVKRIVDTATSKPDFSPVLMNAATAMADTGKRGKGGGGN